MKAIEWDGKPISAPGLYANVDMAAYHGPDLCVGPSISSSGLRKIFTASPMEYWIYSPYNPDRLEEPEKRAFIHGRAAHHLCLGEADFHGHFVVHPEKYRDDEGKLKKWTMSAHYCKGWVREQEAKGLSVLTPAEIESIKGMAGIQPWQKGLEDSGLMNNAMVRAGALQGLVEHTLIAQDPETGVWLKARPDVIPTGSSEASDLKGTLSVEHYKLVKVLDTLRYDMQGELVNRCMQQAIDVRLTNFALIFACKNEPHEVAVREIKPCDMQDSALDIQAAVRTFALCMERGRWPGVGGGEADARYLERSDRSREWADTRRKYLEQETFA